MAIEPVLDERSLVPSPHDKIGERIAALASTLQALDIAGLPPVLRTVRGAADRDLLDGRGLGTWCFDRSVDRDMGRFIATRLTRPPHIDGPGGLMEVVEGKRIMEVTVAGASAIGIGYAGLTDSPAVGVRGELFQVGGTVETVLWIASDTLETSLLPAHFYVDANEVDRDRLWFETRLTQERRRSVQELSNGVDLLAQMPVLFPRLVLGSVAREELGALPSSGMGQFHVLMRHLGLLNLAAEAWQPGRKLVVNLDWSHESAATLNHGRLGPMRDFPDHDGNPVRFSKHTKLGGGYRLYFEELIEGSNMQILVGHFGVHLRTVTS